jgi:hypothetical protein
MTPRRFAIKPHLLIDLVGVFLEHVFDLKSGKDRRSASSKIEEMPKIPPKKALHCDMTERQEKRTVQTPPQKGDDSFLSRISI